MPPKESKEVFIPPHVPLSPNRGTGGGTRQQAHSTCDLAEKSFSEGGEQLLRSFIAPCSLPVSKCYQTILLPTELFTLLVCTSHAVSLLLSMYFLWLTVRVTITSTSRYSLQPLYRFLHLSGVFNKRCEKEKSHPETAREGTWAGGHEGRVQDVYNNHIFPSLLSLFTLVLLEGTQIPIWTVQFNTNRSLGSH